MLRYDEKTGKTLKALFAAMGLGCAISTVQADVVSASGRSIAVDVKVTALREGQLYYRPANGGELARPVEQIQYLQISGWDAFNQAERQQRDGQAETAIASYEQCLAALGDAAPEEAIDRRLLVHCRLVGLRAAQGQFDQAVASYLAVVDKMPAVVATLWPALPSKSDLPVLRKAAELVDKAIATRDRLDPVAVSLEKWRATWPSIDDQQQSASSADRPAGGDRRLPLPVTTRPAERNKAFAQLVTEVRSLVEESRFEQAVEQVEASKKVPGTFFSEEMYYWHGRALLGIAGKQKDKGAQIRRRAGLAFMRVVIQWPRSPLAGECLFRAGEICRDNGQPERAAALWAELLAMSPDAKPWAMQARHALGRLKATTTAPAKTAGAAK